MVNGVTVDADSFLARLAEDADKYEPKAEPVEKPYGEATTEKDVTGCSNGTRLSYRWRSTRSYGRSGSNITRWDNTWHSRSTCDSNVSGWIERSN